jgi:hypothetical protein
MEAFQSVLRVEHIYALAALIWPPLLSISVAIFRWASLRSRVGFVVVGAFATYGVIAIFANLGRWLYWGYFARQQGPIVMTSLRFLNGHAAIIAGALVSVPLVLWLSSLLRAPQPSN